MLNPSLNPSLSTSLSTSYPADIDLLAFLTATGVDIPAGLDLASKMQEAINEWETRTGWGPYLSTGLTETRFFDPPRNSRSLYLQGGLLSLASLAVGVVPGAGGVYGSPGASGSPLTPNQHFYLRPQNAAARGLVVTEVEFVSRIGGGPHSIAITGAWGRVAALPAAAWQAILQIAGLSCVPELQVNLSSGIVKIDDVQFATSSGASPLTLAAGLWQANSDKAVKRNRRITA